MGLKEVAAQNKGSTVPPGVPLVRMKAAPVKTDGERLGNEFMKGIFSTQLGERKKLFESDLRWLTTWLLLILICKVAVYTSSIYLWGKCLS